MSTIRTRLGVGTGLPGLVSRLDDDADLLISGVGSGDLIRMVALLEEVHGIEVGAGDMEGLNTIAAFEALADRHGGPVVTEGRPCG
jgi:hypothetical protein